MSEYIFRTNKPIKCCGVCDASGTGACRLWLEHKGHLGESRHPDCPLIELPEHGDLIDRRKLWKDTEGLGEFCSDIDFINLCDAISEAPTILEASK